jgi:hypothetical protein
MQLFYFYETSLYTLARVTSKFRYGFKRYVHVRSSLRSRKQSSYILYVILTTWIVIVRKLDVMFLIPKANTCKVFIFTDRNDESFSVRALTHLRYGYTAT